MHGQDRLGAFQCAVPEILVTLVMLVTLIPARRIDAHETPKLIHDMTPEYGGHRFAKERVEYLGVMRGEYSLILKEKIRLLTPFFKKFFSFETAKYYVRKKLLSRRTNS